MTPDLDEWSEALCAEAAAAQAAIDAFRSSAPSRSQYQLFELAVAAAGRRCNVEREMDGTR